MGIRSGVLIGIILFLTCSGTFILMANQGLELQRISLGALIIALGMLVDNAIVVTEGVLIGLKRGLTRLEAANAIVKQTMWPLLGATVIAILAFAPIGLSPDATGEFAGSLFWVLMYSLFLSWFTAITLTPFFCSLFFKEEIASARKAGAKPEDPYKGVLFTAYKTLLNVCMRHRVLTVLSMVLMLFAAVAGFGQVQQAFFPPSTTPIFLVDLWLPEGTDIRATDEYVVEIQKPWRVTNGTSLPMPCGWRNATIHADLHTRGRLPQLRSADVPRDATPTILPVLMEEVDDFLELNYPEADVKFKRLDIGPSPAAKIEARFIGRGSGHPEAAFRPGQSHHARGPGRDRRP